MAKWRDRRGKGKNRREKEKEGEEGGGRNRMVGFDLVVMDVVILVHEASVGPMKIVELNLAIEVRVVEEELQNLVSATSAFLFSTTIKPSSTAVPCALCPPLLSSSFTISSLRSSLLHLVESSIIRSCGGDGVLTEEVKYALGGGQKRFAVSVIPTIPSLPSLPHNKENLQNVVCSAAILTCGMSLAQELSTSTDTLLLHGCILLSPESLVPQDLVGRQPRAVYHKHPLDRVPLHLTRLNRLLAREQQHRVLQASPPPRPPCLPLLLIQLRQSRVRVDLDVGGGEADVGCCALALVLPRMADNRNLEGQGDRWDEGRVAYSNRALLAVVLLGSLAGGTWVLLVPECLQEGAGAGGGREEEEGRRTGHQYRAVKLLLLAHLPLKGLALEVPQERLDQVPRAFSSPCVRQVIHPNTDHKASHLLLLLLHAAAAAAIVCLRAGSTWRS
eukprot:759197-Hanusia_phi.AAC.1